MIVYNKVQLFVIKLVLSDLLTSVSYFRNLSELTTAEKIKILIGTEHVNNSCVMVLGLKEVTFQANSEKCLAAWLGWRKISGNGP